MHWILPALAAPFISSVVNFIDKHLATKQVGDYRAMPLYTALIGFIGGIIFWCFSGFAVIGGFGLYFAIAAGFFYSISVVAYYSLIHSEDTSDVVIFASATPIIVLLLSSLFLRELIVPRQLLGFVLVMAAIIIVSVRKKMKMRLNHSIVLLILSMVFCYGFSAVLVKAAFIESSFAVSLFYEGIGLGIGGLSIYAFSVSARKAFWANFKTTPRKTFGVVLFNETMTVVAKYFGFFAFSIGPVSLVSVVGGTQTFYSILIGLILTLFFPHAIREDISRDNLLQKFFAAFILIIGLYFIYI